MTCCDFKKVLFNDNLINKNIGMLKYSSVKLRVLFVQHELITWNRSKHWGYNAHLGFEEVLKDNGVEVTTLLTPFFQRAKEICRNKKFDQIWINDITHSWEPGGCGGPRLTEKFMEWLTTKAPVRLGFCIETVKYNEDEYAICPELYYTFSILKETINYITHILLPDERDIPETKKIRDIPSMWYIPCMPKKYISRKISEPLFNKGVFTGSLYGERLKWMKLPILKELMSQQTSPDNFSNLPKIFDSLHNEIYRNLLNYTSSINNLYNDYLELIRQIRRKSFQMYLEGLKKWVAIINLPSFGKIHTGRVYEGIAAGRPVITMEHSDHPLNNNLFEHGKEILLYPGDDPLTLAEHIKFLLNNPDIGCQIALNAVNKLLEFHTTEKRVVEIIKWIDTGNLPVNHKL